MLEDRIDEIAFDEESTRILTDLVEAQRSAAAAQARVMAAKVAYRDHVREHARLTRSPLAHTEVVAAADEIGYVTATPAPVVTVQLADADFLAERLPQVRAAHLAGLIDGPRLRAIISAARKLHRDASLARLDEEVCLLARVKTVGQLQAWLRAFIARTEPDRQTARTRREFAARGVWINPTDEANAILEAMLSGVDAERFEVWLDRTARTTGGAEDERTLDQKRADILADLLLGRRTIKHICDDPDDYYTPDPATEPADAQDDARSVGHPEEAFIRPTSDPAGGTAAGAVIGVTVPIESLIGLSDDPGITWSTKTSLPAELVRELASEPGTLFYRIFTDHAGQILDVTELGRVAKSGVEPVEGGGEAEPGVVVAGGLV